MDKQRIEIPCAFGTLVAEVAGDHGIYDEIEVDLVRDGKLMQLCCVGTGPDARPGHDGDDLHVYVWDGSDESPAHAIYPDMGTEYWY